VEVRWSVFGRVCRRSGFIVRFRLFVGIFFRGKNQKGKKKSWGPTQKRTPPGHPPQIGFFFRLAESRGAGEAVGEGGRGKGSSQESQKSASTLVGLGGKGGLGADKSLGHFLGFFFSHRRGAFSLFFLCQVGPGGGGTPHQEQQENHHRFIFRDNFLFIFFALISMGFRPERCFFCFPLPTKNSSRLRITSRGARRPRAPGRQNIAVVGDRGGGNKPQGTKKGFFFFFDFNAVQRVGGGKGLREKAGPSQPKRGPRRAGNGKERAPVLVVRLAVVARSGVVEKLIPGRRKRLLFCTNE